MLARFEFDVFLSCDHCDAALAWYMPSLCVRLCGVDVACWQLSDWTHLHS